MRSARQYIGRQAIYHRVGPPYCTEVGTRLECWRTGVGPQEFDCSGLVLASIWDVMGMSGSDWQAKEGPRHVRDFIFDTDLFIHAEQAPGHVVIEQRSWWIDDRWVSRPGHIGIISEPHATTPQLVQTVTREGIVANRSVSPRALILHVLAVNVDRIS